MNKYFHYYCIKTLAVKAGFSSEQAQTIAYASQYVDDATENKKITIRNVPDSFKFDRYKDNTFDPICTSHHWTTVFIKSLKNKIFNNDTDLDHICNKVFVPFHFLPPDGEFYRESTPLSFVVIKNSPLANVLIDDAAADLKSGNADYKMESLIKFGIVLHTFADTWAHAGFSGRVNTNENNIVNIHPVNSKIDLKTVLADAYDAGIGHGEAGVLPDLSNAAWEADYKNRDGRVERNNKEEFLEAAEIIYEKMVTITNTPKESWDLIADKIKTCFEDDSQWKNVFREVEFSYDKLEWRKASLKGGTIEWDNFIDRDEFLKLSYEYSEEDMRWFLFHKAAYEQRKFIMFAIYENEYAAV